MKKLLSLVLALTLVIGGISFGTPPKASAADFPKEHNEALDYLNEIRRTVGIKELELDPYLTKAAQNHADYLTLHGLTSLNTDDGHWEDSKKAGFTGENPGERAKAVGYDNSWVSEVISYDDDTLMKTLDGFLNKTVIHRDFLFSHADIKIGFGISGSNVVFNIGKSTSEVSPPEYFSYPYNGQKDVGTYFSSKWERPDLLKKFGVSKSGFAISYYTPEWADSFTAKITDSKGNDVPFYSDEMGLVHLYPKQELRYNETYTVNVKYGSRNDTWSFTTKSDPSNPTLTEQTFSTEHQEALAHLNAIREKVGVQKLELDPYLTKSAQNHANYVNLHGSGVSHSEDPKKDGFTGANSGDRAKAVGYPSNSTVTEVISYGVKSLNASIDFLLDGPYHRTIVLTYNSAKVGFGVAGDTVVINFGKSTSQVPSTITRYPYNGQNDVGTYFLGKWENPNPIEQFGVSKTGFVISYKPKTWVDNFKSKLVDSKGADIPFFAETDGILYLYPKQDLKAGETYTVTVEYEGVKDTWSFTTKSNTSTPTTPPTTPTKPIDTSVGKQYADFEEGVYWSENMVWAIQQGLIAGYEEKNPKTGKMEKLLKPATELSEAQFLTILFRHSEGSLVMTTAPKDSKWWASQAYVIAEKLKLPLKGAHSNVKAANAPMTRGEMAVVLASYYNMKYGGGKALSERDAVQFMYDAGLSNGYADQNGNTPKTYDSYGADKFLLREHVVTFMWNYDNYLNSKTNQ